MWVSVRGAWRSRLRDRLFERGSEKMKVQRTCCATCIYNPESPLDLDRLEDECRDSYGHFFIWRACHKHWPKHDVCCSGFFHKRGDECTPVQIAKALSMIEYV